MPQIHSIARNKTNYLINNNYNIINHVINGINYNHDFLKDLKTGKFYELFLLP